MSTFEVLLVIYAAILAAAALGVVYRMVVGPTILDRAISTDSLVTLVVMGMALYAAHSQEAWAGPAMLGLTGLAFIGTVTFARFVAREDPMQGRRTRHPREPSTDTGPHEAIHADPSSGEAFEQTADSTPENTFLASEAHATEVRDPLSDEDPLEDPDRPGEPLGDPAQPGELLGNPVQPGDSRGDLAQPAGARADPRQSAEGLEDPYHPEPFEVGDEHGFGAQPGSRGFEDERRHAPDHGTTEEPR